MAGTTGYGYDSPSKPTASKNRVKLNPFLQPVVILNAFRLDPTTACGLWLHPCISDIRSGTPPHWSFARWEFVLGQRHELAACQIIGEDFASLDLVHPTV
jgi:hypothetical protein